jgi:hypothetical protein
MKPRLFYCSVKRLSQIAPVENAIRDLNFEFQDREYIRQMRFSHLSDADFQSLKIEKIDELSHMNAILGTHSDRNKYYNTFKDDVNFPWNNELEVPIDIYNKYMNKVVEFTKEKIASFEESNKGQFDILIRNFKVALELILKMIVHRNEQEKYLMLT